jgi:mitogen-activated protein kinase kinase kinase
MGIKKIGDRVRISVAVKQLRKKTLSNRKTRNLVRPTLIL